LNPELINTLADLDGITAVCAWAVITNTVTPQVIELAQHSPRWDEFTWLRALGGGNPDYCSDVRDIALEELKEEMGV